MATLASVNGTSVAFVPLADVGGAIQKSDEKGKKEIYDFYLSQTGRINKWDLVDLSAPALWANI